MHRPIHDRRSRNRRGHLLIAVVLGLAALVAVQRSRELGPDPQLDPAPAPRAPMDMVRADLGEPGLPGMPAREQRSGALDIEQAVWNPSKDHRILAPARSRVASAVPDGAPAKEEILFELEEPEQAVRVAAIPKVGTLAPGEAVDVLSAVFSTETDVLVRSRATAALTRVKGPAATALLRGRAFDDEDASLRAQALNALAATKGERSTTVFGRALRLDADPEVRLTAIRALQRVGGQWARGYLERATADPDLRISSAAERALSAWPAPSR